MVGHKFAYLRLCSIPTPCHALSYKWQLKENYNKYLMLIIHSFSINLLWPCWLRHQTITFYSKGWGFKSHQDQNFFFTFSDHFQLIWLCFHDINAPRSVWKHFWISESIHYKTTHCVMLPFSILTQSSLNHLFLKRSCLIQNLEVRLKFLAWAPLIK